MTMKKVNSIRRCRLCACEDSFNNFLNIFDDNPELELDIKITKLLPVVVMPWDPMPHLVCRDCVVKLNSFNDFYEASIKAEKFLRTLHPSVPEHEIENLDPVVHLMEPPMTNGNPLKLPPKKRVDRKPKGETTAGPEFARPGENPERTREAEEPFPKPALNCFIVNQITTRDSIFTCRNCFRTFTKQSSALMHACVRLEDCDELETLGVNEGDAAGKSLPPLKIRLFSIRSGLFVCYICENAFENKAGVVEHIKEHFVDENWQESEKKCRQRRRRRGGRQQSTEEDVDWQEAYYKSKTAKPRKRKCQAAPRKRRRPRNEEEEEEGEMPTPGGCEKCGKLDESWIWSTPVKETMEQTTQCSDIPVVSEEADAMHEMKLNGEADAEPSKPPPPEEGVVDPRADADRGGENVPEGTAAKSRPEEDSSVVVGEIAEERGGLENGRLTEPEPEPEPADGKSDEVTVLEVVNNRTPTVFSSCIFCDKIFATKEALIAHQNKHLNGYAGLKAETIERRTSEVRLAEGETYLCSVCAMTFTNRKTLLEHEQFHQVEGGGEPPAGGKRSIRIALAPDSYQEKERQNSNVRGVITITVTSSEKKIPQIDLI